MWLFNDAVPYDRFSVPPSFHPGFGVAPLDRPVSLVVINILWPPRTVYVDLRHPE